VPVRLRCGQAAAGVELFGHGATVPTAR
jgi:hypothetical protein